METGTIKDKVAFGNRIKESGIRTKTLSKELGVTPQTIRSYINGDTFPSIVASFETLCRMCHIDLSELDIGALVHNKRKRYGQYLNHGTNGVGSSVVVPERVLPCSPKVSQILSNDDFFGYKILDGTNSMIIGQSPAMQDVFINLGKIISNPDQESVVLITGETGTGKELAARAIHYNGSRKENPYIGINIASLQNTLMDSELFGHKKGAFTGAITNKSGFLEVVGYGTILLDEIGSLSKESQIRLLRLIQERQFYKLGSTTPVEFKGRIIVATKENLEVLVKSGVFREDLFYRVNVISLDMPPLRNRENDVLDLFSYFVNTYNLKYHTTFKPKPTENGANRLFDYQFPGNVRELENLVRRAIFDSDDNFVRIETNLNVGLS